MKQVLQDLATGRIAIAELPAPVPAPGTLLVRTRTSLISSGSERMLLEFGRSGWLTRARSQPEKVRQVLEKIRTDGVVPTLEAVFARLGEPLPLGYCNAGEVVAVGEGVEGWRIGDRVASNGPHAEMVSVPLHLCARIPESVTDEHAAFTVVGSIALQGTRLLGPALGESVAVIGLGLIGQLSVQILRAAGCRVLGIDPDPARRKLAEELGADATESAPPEGDPVQAGLGFSGSQGLDGVLITATAEDDSIIRQAARMTRKRGRIVLVGVVGLQLDRAVFYEKELTFQVSCSYGPGRYDADYEARGRDYPYAYVRWTEQRNFAAVLGLLADGRLRVALLIGRRLPQAEAATAYDQLVHDRKSLGIVLTYPGCAPPADRAIPVVAKPGRVPIPEVRVGVIGAGEFARAVMLPALHRSGAELIGIAARRAVTAATLARRFGFQSAHSDYRDLLSDARINTIFILTRHDAHAALAAEALRAGKHVFVEKPLALTREELESVAASYRVADRQLMVGFNRRFAPHVVRARQLLTRRTGPASIVMTINAGALPPGHWARSSSEGGGRVLGEAVHWIDLGMALVGRPIVSVCAVANGAAPGAEGSMTIVLSFADGSVSTVHYLTSGHRRMPKERIEIFFDGKILQLDNYRRLRAFGARPLVLARAWRQDKGHGRLVAAFFESLRAGAAPPVPFEDLAHVTAAALAAVESARVGRAVALGHGSAPPPAAAPPPGGPAGRR